MKDFDSPEEVVKRKEQEDPIIMYLIVRKSLEMSPGKIAAQCAHAAQMLLLKYVEFLKEELSPSMGFSSFMISREKFELFQQWLDGSFRKVVLKADEKQWRKLKEEFQNSNRVLVIDAGLTELAPDTETVIGLFPMKKNEVPKVVKRLRVLT